jgi:hypothetical protein
VYCHLCLSQGQTRGVCAWRVLDNCSPLFRCNAGYFDLWLSEVRQVQSRRATYDRVLAMDTVTHDGQEEQRKKLELIKSNIGSYPDFPKPGVLFRWDICFILLELCHVGVLSR